MVDKTAKSIQGDLLDLVIWRVTGKTAGTFEATLEDPRNYGIANLPEVLPTNTTIVIPDVPQPLVTPSVTLWD